MLSEKQLKKTLDETKLLVELFLETNKSDIELSEITGISSSTVGRRLTNRDYILRTYPENGLEIYERVMANRRSNLHKGKILGGQTSILNNLPIRDSNNKFQGSMPKLKLDIVYSEPEKQHQLLRHIALTFRAKLPLLSTLFGLSEEELLKILYVPYTNTESINYLLYTDKTDQEVAMEKILAFYRDLLNAVRSKDRKSMALLIRSVSDYDASQVIKNRKPSEPITDSEFSVIIKHQLKYSLTRGEVSKIFDTNLYNGGFSDSIARFLEANPELRERYEALMEYNSQLHWTGKHGRY